MGMFDIVNTGKLDLTRCQYLRRRDFPIESGVTISEAGHALVIRNAGGESKVGLSAAAAGEVFIGVNANVNLSVTTYPLIEQITVPADAPYTVTLSHGNLVAGQIRIVNSAGTAFSEVALADLNAAGEYVATDATGVLTFFEDDAGLTLTVTTKVTLTAAEALAMFGTSLVNAGTPAEHNAVTALIFPGEFATAQYDVTANFTGSDGAPVIVKTGANGLFTVGGAGTTVGYVKKAPSVTDPFLVVTVI